jgi:hypothetical protein
MAEGAPRIDPDRLATSRRLIPGEPALRKDPTIENAAGYTYLAKAEAFSEGCRDGLPTIWDPEHPIPATSRSKDVNMAFESTIGEIMRPR